MVDDLFGELLEDLFDRRRKKGRRDDDYDDDGDDRRGDGRARTRAPQAHVPPLFCQACGMKNSADARFCADCGDLLPAPGVELRCHGCGVDVPITAKFCSRCGARLGERGVA